MLAITRAPRVGAVVVGACLAVTPLAAQQEAALLELTLEQLMDVQVSSVSKRDEPMWEAPAAVFVVTAEDIRRTGATTIPEALRIVPGMEVAQFSSNAWAVTARGFNSVFANKLLVMIDGRSIYTPLFAGVFWDMRDLMMSEIDRIEVIRGPGATLWGSNAVNGVINVVTKSAYETQGFSARGGVGINDRGMSESRYGTTLGRDAALRVYGKYFDRLEGVDATGAPAADVWTTVRGGFRLDGARGASDFTIQGELFGGDAGQTLSEVSPAPPYRTIYSETVQLSGGHVLAGYTLRAGSSELSLKGYFDATHRQSGSRQDIRGDAIDVEMQHIVRTARHTATWGAGFRSFSFDFAGGFELAVEPGSDRRSLFNAFLQDEMRLSDEIRLVVGSKFEHNEFTGWEIQPSGRLVWSPGERLSLWGAVARAARTPSFSDVGVQLALSASPDGPGGMLVIPRIVPGDDPRSELLTSYELGTRVAAHSRVWLDVAGYVGRYSGLGHLETGTAYPEVFGATSVLIAPQVIRPTNLGRTHGVEAFVTVAATDGWTLTAGGSTMALDIVLESGEDPATPPLGELDLPRWQGTLRSILDLPSGFELDGMAIHVAEIEGQAVPAYTRLDARLGWKRGPLRLSLGGRNLLEARHAEWGPSIVGQLASEIERDFYLRASWNF